MRGILDKDLNDFRLAANPRLEFETSGPDADGKPRLGLDLGVYYRRNAAFQPGWNIIPTSAGPASGRTSIITSSRPWTSRSAGS